MKRILVIFLICNFILLAILPLSGCGIKEKAQRAVTEKLVEKALGDAVDIKGDSITVKGEDGEKITIGGGEWPDSDLAKNIPKFTKGKISTTMMENNVLMVYLEEVETGDFEDYLKQIKKTYSEDAQELKSDDAISYSAKDGKGTAVGLKFEKGNGTVIISVTKEEQ